ncbi:putative Histidinol-phosphate/aromatic aminotransferase and cobyric acid decarboxylase(Pyridoxal phosphate-dependent transferase, major domain,1-254) [Magnetospirillum sp. XM-1]|nr:putative Histidinol-phosphate/aromatic aminotransferase and cobyric acid decarboxylase(Pyridoxal phosphate-dependent transferase, major domain,1-254) [Magnetospirillum sp. XM-1]
MVAGTGSQALIQALPRITETTDAAILAPTYGEHARAWTAAGHAVREVAGLDDIGEARVVVAVNPNNPDGRVIAPQRLLELAARLAARGGLLIVDEAFCDERPELSLTAKVGPGLVVLRSFGKFFGLAGLRLGFAVAEERMAARLADHLGPWPVSGPAFAIGAAALADQAWTEATITRLNDAAGRLDAILKGTGLEVLGGTCLFRLARHDRAGEVYERLGRAGILVRAFAFRADILRFGLPGSPAEEARLERALAG